MVEGITIHITDLGRDVVAQEQPDGRLVLAVRPAQSFANAVQKTREAISLARSHEDTAALPSAEAVRRLLRPYWAEGTRWSLDDLLENERALEPPAAVALGPEPPPAPVEQQSAGRVPLRRRVVKMWMLGATAVTFSLGGLVGWQATTAHTAIFHEATHAPFAGPVFDAFAGSGASCDQTAPGRAACVAPDGTVMAAESLIGANQETYHFFYDHNKRITTRQVDDRGTAELWAIRDAATLGTSVMVDGKDLGAVVVSGTEMDRVLAYGRAFSKHFEAPAMRYSKAGPPVALTP